MIAYYGFILLVAFNKPLLAQKLGTGVTTIGMPAGRGGDRLHHHHHLDLHPARATASSTT